MNAIKKAKTYKIGNLFAVPDEIQLPDKGNNVLVFNEDHRFPRTKTYTDAQGKEQPCLIYGLDGKPIGEEKVYPIIYSSVNHNLIVDYGRKKALNDMFLTAQAKFVAGSVGDSSTGPSDNTRAGLHSELIVDTARPGLTDTSGGALVLGDIVSEVSGSNFWKIVVQFVYPSFASAMLDPYNGQTFAEFGMHDTTVLPAGTPPDTTSFSGNMLARYVPGSSFVKSFSFATSVQWTVRA